MYTIVVLGCGEAVQWMVLKNVLKEMVKIEDKCVFTCKHHAC